MNVYLDFCFSIYYICKHNFFLPNRIYPKYFIAMKRTILLIVFISIGFGVKAQWWKPQHKEFDTVEYVVMYDLKFKEDTIHLNYCQTEKQMLSIGSSRKITSYRAYNSYKLDMELKRRGEDGTSLDWIQSANFSMDYVATHLFDIFKDYDKGIITTNDHIFQMGLYEYEEPFDSFNWQITAETDTISDYICQKAICYFGGRTWLAWFTTEIPISDGPYKFCGLPGLILNIADTENHYSFEFVSIEEPSELMMVYDVIKDRVPTTKKEFFRQQDRLKNNISHGVKEMTSNEKAVQKAVEYEMSKNNPIELDR